MANCYYPLTEMTFAILIKNLLCCLLFHLELSHCSVFKVRNSGLDCHASPVRNARLPSVSDLKQKLAFLGFSPSLRSILAAHNGSALRCFRTLKTEQCDFQQAACIHSCCHVSSARDARFRSISDSHQSLTTRGPRPRSAPTSLLTTIQRFFVGQALG